MARIDSPSELAFLLEQMTFGASYSVELQATGEGVFRGFSDWPLADVMALSDSRLELRAILEDPFRIARDFDDEQGGRGAGLSETARMFEGLGWEIRVSARRDASRLLIVDRERVLRTRVTRGSELLSELYEEEADVAPFVAAFESLWAGGVELLGLYLQPEEQLESEVAGELFTFSDEFWSQTIRDLSRRPELMHEMGSRYFEVLVAELLARQGLEVKLTPPSKDGGRDILAQLATPFGDQLLLVETKKYAPSNPVGVEIVRSLYGVVELERATAGVLVTTSRFTRGALDLGKALRYRLSLQDFHALKQWLGRLTES